jgi:transposase-like protein
MAVLLAVLFIVGVWEATKYAGEHARADYHRSRDAKVREAGGASLGGRRRRSVIRRHRAGYWTREVAHGFPVTRTGLHTGWQAHRTASAHEKHKREEARTTSLETLATLLPSLREHRERQEKALQEIRKQQGQEEAPGEPGVPPLPSETVEPRADPGPALPPEPAAQRDSDWLQPGEPRCEGCGGTGRNKAGDDACPACRGWGSAAPDPYSPLAPVGAICTACGNPGTEHDPVLDDPQGLIHSSHAEEAQERYQAALATMNGTAAANGSGSRPATEGGHMPTGTASADVTYDQLQAEATKVVNEAEQQLASLRASRLSNMVEGMAGMVNDSNSLSRAAEIDEAIREQMKAAQQVLDAAQAFKDGLRRDHGAQNEAHQNAPIPLGAQPEFYSG